MTSTTYGYGSVYRRESDARWVASVEVRERRGAPRARKVWYGWTREEVEVKLHAYRADHPARDYLGRAEYLRRARELATHTSREWWALVRATPDCHYCGVRLGLWDITQDHKTPVSRGGSDGIDNLAVTCPACNLAKHDSTEAEYRAVMSP